MSEVEIRGLAEGLIDKYLRGHKRNKFTWKFILLDTKSYLGSCEINDFWNTGKIGISKYLVGNSKELVKSTLLHEIAHGLDSIENGKSGHGWTWRQIMRELWQDPNRTATEEETKKFQENVNYKYTGHCPECGARFYRSRMPAKAKLRLDNYYYCGKCSRAKERTIYIEFKQNY